MGRLTETYHRSYIVPGIMLKISAQASVLSTLSEVFGTIIYHLSYCYVCRNPLSSRSVFFLGLLAGGPRAMWSTFLISMGGMWVTAAVLAEICSTLPLSGSIYIWAAESAGPKYGRFFGFLAAWWACTAWMTFVAGNCQVRCFSLSVHTRPIALTDHYVLYPFSACRIRGGLPWRYHHGQYSVESCRVGSLRIFLVRRHCPKPSASCVPFTSFLPTTEDSAATWYSRLFKFSLGLMMLDFFLNVIWLPIGASKTYGLRTTQEAFWDTCVFSSPLLLALL